MGRILEPINVGRRSLWTLFDTGASQNYIAEHAVGDLHVTKMQGAYRVAIDGKHRALSKRADLEGKIQGKRVMFSALVIDDLGVDKKRLDHSAYPDEFVEY